MSGENVSNMCRAFYEAITEAKAHTDNNLRLSAYYNLHLRQEWQAIADFVPNQSDCRVLDIGCGPSYLLEEERLGDGCEYVGLDIALEALPLEKISENAHFAIGNAESLPFGSESFQVVIASHLIEHLHDSDKFLSECIRVLKNGGRLVIVTPNVRSVLRNRYLTRLAFVMGVAIAICLSILEAREYLRKLHDFFQARQGEREVIRAHSQEEHVHEFAPEELESKLIGHGLRVVQTRFSGLHVFMYSLVLNDLFGRFFYRISSRVESWQSAKLGRTAYDMAFFMTKGLA